MYRVEYKLGIMWYDYPERAANFQTAYSWTLRAMSDLGATDTRIVDESTGQSIRPNTLAMVTRR
jgi:hypothetical protein